MEFCNQYPDGILAGLIMIYKLFYTTLTAASQVNHSTQMT